MKKAFIILFFFITGYTSTIGQQNDTIEDTFDLDFKEFTEHADSILLLWYKQHLPFNREIEQNIFDNDTASPPYFSDEIILTQLNRMNSYIEMTFNTITKQYIDFYSKKRRKLVSYMLGNSEYYFPYFEEALDRYGLPLELKYLPIIESALNPRAISRARAVGLWQFILPTGKLYGLKVTSFIDERMDVIKSSDAAARYLRDLYNVFQDWHLVLAAYNCGPGNVNKAIKRSGKNNYWGIYKYLPRETRGYVPAFIGAAYTFHYYKELNIIPRKTFMPNKVDTIYVHKMLHLKQVSELLQIPLELLQILNPQYKKDIIPALPEQPLPLYLPVEYISNFIALGDSVYKYKDTLFFKAIRPSTYVINNYANMQEVAIYHKVKKGETLQSIARKYNVSSSDIASWNHISKKRPLKVGKTIVIYVLRKKEEVKSIPTNINSVDSTNTIVKTDSMAQEFNKEIPKTHIVRQGDTLFSIAKQYNVSVDELCRINNISNASHIKIGQKLILPSR
ncbi:MAG: LysM peptidoglycan-binding domain-containing protein [Bacteroidales bacterium]|nr:LysM peptidoglycan-binding domain-containing protein [Bacteroidales bacterium]